MSGRRCRSGNKLLQRYAVFTAGKTVTNYPLCENGTYTLTHFLASGHFGFQQNTDLGVSYSTLIDSQQWRELFGSGVFASKSIVQSHPYNLQTTLSLNTYICLLYTSDAADE